MDELEVYFCDLCNTSVPAQDLDAGSAKRIRDKVVGACCVKELGGARGAVAGQAKSMLPSATGVGASIGGFFVILAAVAAATMFLDWRIHDESGRIDESIARVATTVRPLEDQIGDLEARLDRTLETGALEPFESQIQGIAAGIASAEQGIVQSVQGNARRLRDLGSQITALDSGQRDHLVRISALHGDLASLRARLDEVADSARRAGIGSTVVPSGAGWATPSEYSGDATNRAVSTSRPSGAADAELPEHLQRYVAQLADEDDGARFEAVDELLQSQDVRVYSHLLPLVSDPDPFVRRFVCEGLREYPARASVDALLGALSDPESLVRYTAHSSLKALTKRDFPFDPDATSGKRASMKRRWVEWWKKNAEGMF